MKFAIRLLAVFLGLTSVTQANVIMGFCDSYNSGIVSNLANAGGVVTDGMSWGIVVDTAGNGFANSGAHYDAYAGGPATAGYLSANGAVTDDYYIPGGVTVDATPLSLLEGDFTTSPGHGSITDDMAPIAYANGLAAGQKFALIWFSSGSSSDGSKYGFFTDAATFLMPGEGSLTEFGEPFQGNDPIRSASNTFGVVAATSKITVFDGVGTGSSPRTDNVGTFTFANAVSGTTGGTQTFTIQNTGGANLASIAVSKAGTGNPSDFTVNVAGMSSTLAANATTTFTVAFAPTATGTRSATIQIASNDSTQNPFRINVTGTGTVAPAPSIALFEGNGTGGNQRTDNAAAFTFAPVLVGLSDPTQTFTIQNNGTADLTGLNAVVATADPADFTVVTSGLASTLAPNATTTFTVTFSPATAGTRTALVTLKGTGVADFRVNFSGHGTANSEPRISVLKGDTNGTELFSGVNTVAFPTTLPGASSVAQTFTIENVGTADLTGIAVTKAVAGNPDDFVVNAAAVSSTLAPGASTSFTVLFHPPSATFGSRTAVIQVASNDASDNPFIFTVKGQTHTISFDQDSLRRMEATETVTLPVRLSSAFGTAFTVPVTFTSNPSNLAYTHTPATVLSFTATQTVANVTLSLKDNLTIEAADKILTATLGTPSAAGVTLGAHPSMRLEVWDNDTAPTVTLSQGNQIVSTGTAVTLGATVTGSDPMTIQWKKNNVAVAGDSAKTSVLNLTASAALTDAGTFTITATNKRSTVTKTVLLDVVDNTATKVRFDVNANATLTQNATGTGMTYQWYHKTGPNTSTPIVNNTKYANATTKTLTIKKLVAADDAGDYFCTVTAFGKAVAGGVITLQVPTVIPPTVDFVFSPGVAYTTYPSFQIPFHDAGNDVPTKITCTGLPTGLVCNAITGIVSGKPTKSGLNQPVKVTLTNGLGHVDIPTSISIVALPVGTCVGLVARHDATNGSLGGRLDLIPTVTGAFTGTLKLGGLACPFSGTMITPTAGAHSTATVTVKRPGTPVLTPVTLTLDLDPGSDMVTGTVAVQGSASVALITGWRNLWHTTLPNAMPVGANQLGAHSFKLKLDTASAAMSNLPTGYGYGTITTTAAGVTTIAGRTPDGNTITSSNGVLSQTGEVLLFQPLYTNHGSMTGVLEIASDANHTINSHLDWQKLVKTVARDYAAFGLIGVDATGGKYVSTAPISGLGFSPLGTNNAKLVFLGGGVNVDSGSGMSLTNPNVSMRISDKYVVKLPAVGADNPGKITALTLTVSTGAFSGKFSLTDGTVQRNLISFQGQIVTPDGGGFGYFLLPQLASPPTTTATTSPILSGAVTLEKQPF